MPRIMFGSTVIHRYWQKDSKMRRWRDVETPVTCWHCSIMEACPSNSAGCAYSWKCAVDFNKPFIIQNSTAMYSTALVTVTASIMNSFHYPFSMHLVLMFTLNLIFDSEWKTVVSSVTFLLLFNTGTCSVGYVYGYHVIFFASC